MISNGSPRATLPSISWSGGILDAAAWTSENMEGITGSTKANLI